MSKGRGYEENPEMAGETCNWSSNILVVWLLPAPIIHFNSANYTVTFCHFLWFNHVSLTWVYLSLFEKGNLSQTCHLWGRKQNCWLSNIILTWMQKKPFVVFSNNMVYNLPYEPSAQPIPQVANADLFASNQTFQPSWSCALVSFRVFFFWWIWKNLGKK